MKNYIAIDYESYLISKEEPIPTPVCLSYYDGKNLKGVIVGKEQMEAFLSKLLTLPDTAIIAHNMSFELLVTYKHFPKLRDKVKAKLERGELICTKIYEQLISNTEKKGSFKFDLATLVNRYFKEDISDTKGEDSWRMRYCELDGIPLKDWPKEAVEYAEEDSVWAHKLFFAQQATLKVDYNLSVAADFWLNWMGLSGLVVDKSRVHTLEQEIIDKLAPMYDHLEELGFVVRKKDGKWSKKMKKMREFVTEHVKAPEKTAKGAISTSGESLNRYLGDLTNNTQATAILESFLYIMKYEKVLSSFVARLKEAEPLIRTQYNAVVSSGRTSSRTSPFYPSVNIQQMPRTVEGVTWDIRNCFVPREGYKICSIDYSGLELSATANQLYNLTGRSEMREVLNRGDTPTDMHSMFAYRIKNMKAKKVITSYEEFVSKKKEEGFKEFRQLAKPINLGFPGGIGYDTMRKLLAKEGIFPKLQIVEKSKYEDQISWKRGALRKLGHPARIRRVAIDEFQLVIDELVELKQELFHLYPDLADFLSEGHKGFLTGETLNVKNEFGEWEKEPVYKFETDGFKRDYCTYTKLCNGLLMQSPAAVGAKKAMVKIISKYSESTDVNPLAFIHDEIVFEIKDSENMADIVRDVSEILIDEMQTVLTSVRITVEAEVFDYWKKSGGFYEATYWKDPKEGTDNTLKHT